MTRQLLCSHPLEQCVITSASGLSLEVAWSQYRGMDPRLQCQDDGTSRDAGRLLAASAII